MRTPLLNAVTVYRRRRRGSTFILVLGMLSILVFIAVAFSYTSRLEAIASNNFGQLTSARAAAATGLPAALPLITNSTKLTSTLQPWQQTKLQSQSTDSAANPNASANRGTSARALTHKAASSAERTGGHSPADFVISDLSARVNLNMMRDEAAFERFLEAIFTRADTRLTQGSSRSRAKALFSLRRDSPNTTAVAQPDIRKPAQGNRFESLTQLHATKHNPRGIFTDQELRTLGQYVTVFSESPEVFNRADGVSLPKIALSDDMDASGIASKLEMAFPDKEPKMLKQFAANLKDYSDIDDIPTVVQDTSGTEALNVVIGVEQVPLVTEVYADAKTQIEGDQGQFVEIHNPWAKPISMANWRLSIGGAVTTQGAAINGYPLNATLPPGGYLIITDNYDHPAAKSAPGTGCFLAIFGIRKDDNHRQLVEVPGFDLPDRNATVSLLDSQGNLVDVFRWDASASENATSSYQRNDPRVRACSAAEATPFNKALQGVYTGTAAREQLMTQVWQAGNQRLSGPMDLFRIPCGFSMDSGSAEVPKIIGYCWQTPLFAHEDTSATNNAEWRSNLDAHILDLFTVADEAPESEANTEEYQGYASRRASRKEQRSITTEKLGNWLADSSVRQPEIRD